MDPTRAGAVLARHAGIDEETGQLAGEGLRRLVISSGFYSVYTSAGRKAGGLVNLFCWAHIRRYFVRAGDANPAQLAYWTAAWLERIKNPVRGARGTHGRLGHRGRAAGSRRCRRPAGASPGLMGRCARRDR
jgi:hypothetical protein